MDCSPPGSVHGISQARILQRLPFPSPGDLPDPGMEPASPALAGRFSPLSRLGSPCVKQDPGSNRKHQTLGVEPSILKHIPTRFFPPAPSCLPPQPASPLSGLSFLHFLRHKGTSPRKCSFSGYKMILFIVLLFFFSQLKYS